MNIDNIYEVIAMGRRKQRRIRRDWLLVIKDYQDSGLTAKGYCVANGINHGLFMRWYKVYEFGTLTIPRKKEMQANDFIKLDIPVNSTAAMDISFPDGIKVSAYNNCDTKLLHSAIVKIKELL